MKLLAKAKNYSIDTREHREISSEEIELSLAWLKNEISTGQATFALFNKESRNSSSATCSRIARVIKQAYLAGVINVIKK